MTQLPCMARVMDELVGRGLGGSSIPELAAGGVGGWWDGGSSAESDRGEEGLAQTTKRSAVERLDDRNLHPRITADGQNNIYKDGGRFSFHISSLGILKCFACVRIDTLQLGRCMHMQTHAAAAKSPTNFRAFTDTRTQPFTRPITLSLSPRPLLFTPANARWRRLFAVLWFLTVVRLQPES